MRISYLGIELHRIQKKDLHCVRRWRNLPEVRQCMRHQQRITAAAHLKWFRRTQSKSHLYFILCIAGQRGAVLQLSDIDYEVGQAEAGIFLGESSYTGTHLPWMGSYVILCFAFGVLRLQQIWATVNKDNITARTYNASLGFRQADKLDAHFSRYVLSAYALDRAVLPYRRLLWRLAQQPMCISFLPQEHTLRALICTRSGLQPNHRGNLWWST